MVVGFEDVFDDRDGGGWGHNGLLGLLLEEFAVFWLVPYL
jgi:hypothetical protein